MPAREQRLSNGNNALVTDGLVVTGGDGSHTNLLFDNVTGAFLPSPAPAIPAGPTDAFTHTYSFGGGTHDYTADANYTLSGFSGTTYQGSGILGDGTNAPYFYCFKRGSTLQTLSITGGNTLRIGLDNSYSNGDAFPFAEQCGSILIPLPLSDTLTVDLVLSTNCGVGTSDAFGDRGFVAIGGYASNNTLYVLGEVGFVWDTTNHWIAESYQTVQSTSTRSGETQAQANAAFVSGNVATRRYKFILDGPTIQLLGAPTSGSPTAAPTSVIFQKWDGAFLPVLTRKFLILSCAGTNGATRSLYAELQASLVISGQRSWL